MHELRKGFGSDNHPGAHPAILAAISAANDSHAHSYGDDPYTVTAINKFHEHFGADIEVLFVFNGTGANVISLAAMSRSYYGVICASTAHIYLDESTAPERFTGCRLLPIPTIDGKLTPALIDTHITTPDSTHQVQPRIVSITQSTEVGTVYTLEELETLSAYVHARGFLLHMDGARLANAAASLGVGLNATSGSVGVDLLSFGGTKNGLMFGDAIVAFNKDLATALPYHQKQGLQLASKMRFIGAQFTALLSNDLWHKNAAHANRMAQLLATGIQDIPNIRITQATDANAVFLCLPPEYIEPLQKEFFFYVWNAKIGEVRWMTAFDTTTEDVHNFIATIKRIVC